MAPVIIQPRESQPEASNAGSALQQAPGQKRKIMENVGVNSCVPPSTMAPPTKILKMEESKLQESSVILKTYSTGATTSGTSKKARETRLEQNRKAARESRRRKKVMIEDLQRSVIFFSRANGTLKHQNDDLTRLLMQAQAQVSVIESTANNNNNNTATAAPASATTASSSPVTAAVTSQQVSQPQQQASPEIESSSSSEKAPYQQPPPTGTVTTAAAPVYPPVPAMQPGATMQAMASFQQAAAAAMQVAVQGMQGISPGVSLASLGQPAPTTGSASAQQAYNDTMTALAMQQAAIAAAAIQPHVMAQIVGSAPTWAVQPTQGAILPTTMQAAATAAAATASASTSATATTATTTIMEPAPVPVAPMTFPHVAASLKATTQRAGES